MESIVHGMFELQIQCFLARAPYSSEVPSDWNGDLTYTRLLSGVLLACAAGIELYSLLLSEPPGTNESTPEHLALLGKTFGFAKLVFMFAIFGTVEGIVRSSQLLFINIGY